MDKFASVSLEKLIGSIRATRLLSMILLSLWSLVGCFLVASSTVDQTKTILINFLTWSGYGFGAAIFIFNCLTMYIFRRSELYEENLKEMMTETKQQADLLDLLKPMLADAFRLDPDRIKPALVERFIERVIDELTSDYSAASRNFLLQQPVAVKDLVRSRCTEILKSRQEELELHLHTARQGARLMPQHEIELLVNAMAKAREVLNLIPDRFTDSDIPMPKGARIVPEPTPYHVAEAQS